MRYHLCAEWWLDVILYLCLLLLTCLPTEPPWNPCAHFYLSLFPYALLPMLRPLLIAFTSFVMSHRSELTRP